VNLAEPHHLLEDAVRVAVSLDNGVNCRSHLAIPVLEIGTVGLSDLFHVLEVGLVTVPPLGLSTNTLFYGDVEKDVQVGLREGSAYLVEPFLVKAIQASVHLGGDLVPVRDEDMEVILVCLLPSPARQTLEPIGGLQALEDQRIERVATFPVHIRDVNFVTAMVTGHVLALPFFVEMAPNRLT
jgi:hypothetical protein